MILLPSTLCLFFTICIKTWNGTLDLGGVSQNLSSVTNDSFVISYWNPCFWLVISRFVTDFCHLSLKKTLWNGPWVWSMHLWSLHSTTNISTTYHPLKVSFILELVVITLTSEFNPTRMFCFHLHEPSLFHLHFSLCIHPHTQWTKSRNPKACPANAEVVIYY